MFIVAEMRIMNNKRFEQTNELDTEHMGQEKSHPALESIPTSQLNRERN